MTRPIVGLNPACRTCQGYFEVRLEPLKMSLQLPAHMFHIDDKDQDALWGLGVRNQSLTSLVPVHPEIRVWSLSIVSCLCSNINFCWRQTPPKHYVINCLLTFSFFHCAFICVLSCVLAWRTVGYMLALNTLSQKRRSYFLYLDLKLSMAHRSSRQRQSTDLHLCHGQEAVQPSSAWL